MRVWWESRHPLPLTNTTEHSGNCWLTVPGHNHAAMQEPSFTNKTVSFAPANHNAYSHTRWQRYYHLKIIVFFLLVTPFLKSNWQHQPPWPLSLAPWCICTYWQQREIEGRGPHQKAPSVLIDMHQLSSYRLLQLLRHWRKKRQAGRQAGIELLHRDIDEKPTAFSMIQPLCWALGKQDRAAL